MVAGAGEGNYLYRFDTRSPLEIQQLGGFKSWGDNMNLLEHANGTSIANKTSGYIGTSTNKLAALELSSERVGYIYKIKPINGVNVNAKLGTRSPFPWESEVAVPKSIPSKMIVESWQVNF